MRFLAFQIRISFNEQVANTSEYILILKVIHLYTKVGYYGNAISLTL